MRRNRIMPWGTRREVVASLNVMHRLIVWFHGNGCGIDALSLLLQRRINQWNQSNKTNQSCNYEDEYS